MASVILSSNAVVSSVTTRKTNYVILNRNKPQNVLPFVENLIFPYKLSGNNESFHNNFTKMVWY